MRKSDLRTLLPVRRRAAIAALLAAGVLLASCGSDAGRQEDLVVPDPAPAPALSTPPAPALPEESAGPAEGAESADALEAAAAEALAVAEAAMAAAHLAQAVAEDNQVAVAEAEAALAWAQAAEQEARADAAAVQEEADAADLQLEEAERSLAGIAEDLAQALEEVRAAELAVAAAEAEAAAALARAEAAELEATAALAQAEAAEAEAETARAELQQAQESSTTTTSAPATTPPTTSAAASPPGPPQDVATPDTDAGDMGDYDMGDYDMAGDVMADDMGGSNGRAAAAGASPGSPELPPGGCRGCVGNTFEDYGVNPFVRTDEDPLSTFALDVDTASYVVSRNFLLGDELPPPEAVRVEEFVNYFDGGYEPVPDEFDIDLEAAPSPFAAEGNVLLRVGVRAPDLLDGVALPESIVVVMDRSGSMGGDAGYRGQRLERIQLAHRAVELLLEGLADGTRVGIVSYDDQIATVVEPTDVAGNRDSIMTRVRDEVHPRGSTNAAAGLVAGYEMALAEADAGRSVLVILLSDGVANVGATRTTEILEQIGERADIGLSTIGVGLGPFNDALMEQLANSADGTYHYIDSFREAGRILADNLPSLLSVAARDAKVQVEFDPATVRSYRLLGFENRDVADEDFRDNTVDAGEVGLGQSSTALYELELVPAADRQAGVTTLATVTLRYEHPRRGSITEIEASIATGDLAGSFAVAGARFRLAAVVAEFAEVLRRSPFVDEAHADMAVLAAQAAVVAEDLAEDADAADLVVLIDAARRVSGDGSSDG